MEAATRTARAEGAGVLPQPASRDASACAYSGKRLLWLDAARSAALLAMIVFHLFRDLEFFGAIPTGTTAQGAWAVAARAIAGSFILLSGISLVMAHERGFRLGPWAKRLVLISASAALVSLVTYLAFPERFIYFGILHCIAASGLLGVALLRPPAWVLWAVTAGIIMSDRLWGGAVFGSPWLAWTGLSGVVRPSLDFLPLIPWFALFVIGMALAKSLPLSRWDLPVGHANRLVRLTWPGRHSLAIYLIHQPILIGLLWIIFAAAG